MINNNMLVIKNPPEREGFIIEQKVELKLIS